MNFVLWHHGRIKIVTSIFGENGVTHDSAISPHPEALGVLRLLSHGRRHTSLNLDINSHNISYGPLFHDFLPKILDFSHYLVNYDSQLHTFSMAVAIPDGKILVMNLLITYFLVRIY